MRYSRYQDAMIAQARIADWYQTDMGVRYLHGFMEDLNNRHREEAKLDVNLLMAIQYRMVADAEPVYVSYDACELVDHARETFEPEAVLPSDPFVPSGFALLAKPLIINDAPLIETKPGRAPDGLIPIRGIGWMAMHSEDLSQGTFWIGFYNNIDDEIELNPNDHRFQDPIFVDMMRRYTPLQVAHQWQWTWGRKPNWEADSVDVSDGETIQESLLRAMQQAKLVQTLWRIGSQFTPAKQMPERQLRKDAKRKGLKHHEEINLVVLRKVSPSTQQEPTGRQLTVQFPVNGYWAIRHTVDGPRQVWVKSHMKGPEDAPLVIKKRAWEFKR
jgi:hypothetical protein